MRASRLIRMLWQAPLLRAREASRARRPKRAGHAGRGEQGTRTEAHRREARGEARDAYGVSSCYAPWLLLAADFCWLLLIADCC